MELPTRVTKKKDEKEDDGTGRHEWRKAGILKRKKRGQGGVRKQKKGGEKKRSEVE